MDRANQELVLEELLNRFQSNSYGKKLRSTVGDYTGAGERLCSHLTEKQMAFVNDAATRKSLLCSRRAGKTVADVALLGRTVENYPRSLAIYISTTKDSAKRIAWPELNRFSDTYKLSWKFFWQDGYVLTPGGSMIVLAGVDKRRDIEKFRGLAPHTVVIDEVASIPPHIEKLIESVIEPGLEDYHAPLVLSGTPGEVESGYFWEATGSAENSEWSRHSWNLTENPYLPRWAGKENWQELALQRLAEILVRKGWTWDTPRFQREYLGKWCADTSRKLYAYNPAVNLVAKRPTGIDWRYVMGVDLGASGTAFVVWAYSIELSKAFVVWAEKHKNLRLHQIAEIGKGLEGTFQPMRAKVIDTGGLGGVISNDLSLRHGFSCVPAVKKDKMATIESLNDDLTRGAAFVLEDHTQALRSEWQKLEKDENGEEKSKTDNHCSDAALYSWRYCRHYLAAPEKEPQPGEKGYGDYAEDKMWRDCSKTELRDIRKAERVSNRRTDLDVSDIMSQDWGDEC